MSAFALISGRLSGEAVTRTTKTGGQVTFFKLKIASDSALEFWSVATFSDAVREELDGLSEGAALAATGELRIETYEWNGETRINRKLVADRILALKPKPRTKDKSAGANARDFGRDYARSAR